MALLYKSCYCLRQKESCQVESTPWAKANIGKHQTFVGMGKAFFSCTQQNFSEHLLCSRCEVQGIHICLQVSHSLEES